MTTDVSKILIWHGLPSSSNYMDKLAAWFPYREPSQGQYLAGRWYAVLYLMTLFSVLVGAYWVEEPLLNSFICYILSPRD